jgi:hypothetical protein
VARMRRVKVWVGAGGAAKALTHKASAPPGSFLSAGRGSRCWTPWPR